MQRETLEKYLNSIYTLVVEGSYCGLMDKNGKIVLPVEYKYIMGIIDNELVKVQRNESYWLLSLKAPSKLYQCSMLTSYYYNTQFFQLQIGNETKYGYYDFETKQFKPTIYDTLDIAKIEAKDDRIWYYL